MVKTVLKYGYSWILIFLSLINIIVQTQSMSFFFFERDQADYIFTVFFILPASVSIELIQENVYLVPALLILMFYYYVFIKGIQELKKNWLKSCFWLSINVYLLAFFGTDLPVK